MAGIYASEGVISRLGLGLMLLRRDADTDFAGCHRRVDPFLALDLDLMGLFFFLPGLGFFQPLERRWRKQDHDQGDGAQRSYDHDAQIAHGCAENRGFFLFFFYDAFLTLAEPES